MEKIKLFQAPTEHEALLVSNNGKTRIIHISFDGQRQIESEAVVILRIPPGKNRNVSYVTRTRCK